MFFLARWQVVARGNHSFAQTFYRHDERWACMLCGVTAHYARIRVLFRAKLLKFERKIAKIALKVRISRNIDLNYV